MIAKVESACLVGMEAARILVEVSLARGLPRFSIVGLPDASVREAKDRVVAAVRNSGFKFPSRRVTVNLAPAELKKEGSCFDLAIAVGILLASEAISPPRWPRCVWLGELALDGSIRSVRGALALVRGLFKEECDPSTSLGVAPRRSRGVVLSEVAAATESKGGGLHVVLPAANYADVSFFSNGRAIPFQNLREVVQWLQEEKAPAPAPVQAAWSAAPVEARVDLAEIKGQTLAKRALEIAAAGGHNLAMIGCPGTGKSMLAQALPGILPPWDLEEALEASHVHSVAGALGSGGLLRERPFRSPHHSISSVALIGGGDVPAPGEISLAHRGVLFLDELPEFKRDALEALRQPLEEGVIHIQRVRGRATYPAEFLLIAAMNPCSCGFRGHPLRECECSASKVQKYLSKISGPFLDRFDLHVELPVLKVQELFDEKSKAESSADAQKRVARARQIQDERYGGARGRRIFNARLRPSEAKRFCALPPQGQVILKAAVERLGLSARAFDRIRKVSRTIADLAVSETIEPGHVAEAIQFRVLDRPPAVY